MQAAGAGQLQGGRQCAGLGQRHGKGHRATRRLRRAAGDALRPVVNLNEHHRLCTADCLGLRCQQGASAGCVAVVWTQFLADAWPDVCGSWLSQDFVLDVLEAVDSSGSAGADDSQAAAVTGQAAPKTEADSSGGSSSGPADSAVLETSVKTGLGTAGGTLSAAGGGVSTQALLWAAIALAALAFALWAVRRRRRRRRAWGKE